MEIYHYGFILFCNIWKPNSNAFIGNSISSEKKLMGNVMFHPEQLGPKCNLKLKQQYCLVRYTLKTGTNWVDQIEPIETFAKSQYKGELSVDGIGNVSFKKEGESVPILLNGGMTEAVPESVKPKSEPAKEVSASSMEINVSEAEEMTELPFAFFDVSDLKMTLKTSEGGLKVLEFVLPYERILEGAGDGEWKVGFVNYYVPSLVTYIRNHFENRLFIDSELDDRLCLFSTAEEEPDTKLVGRVNTGKNVYFIRYQLTGEEMQNPKEPGEFLPKATNVCFVAKIPHKRVVSIMPEENGVRITLCADVYARTKENIELTEPAPGEAIDSFLNRYTTNCLKEGRITEGLEMIEKYKDQLSEERYQTIRFRLLPRLYKDTLSEESRIQTIETIDSLLTFTNKVNFRLTLYLEKGNKLLQGKQLEEAAEAYRSWIDLYNEYVAANPEAEAGLRIAYGQVEQGLRICRGEDGEIGNQILDDQGMDDSYDDIGLDDFLVELLERKDLRGLGKENAEKYNDLTTLSKEDADELRELLEKQENSDDKDLWALAKIYTYLPDAPVEVIDENIVAARRDKYFEQALFQDALHLLSEEGSSKPSKLSIQFLCAQALTFRVDESRVAATIGACCLTAEQFEDALEGKLSVHEVLEQARRVGLLSQIAKCLAIICYRNGSVRKWMEDCLARNAFASDETIKALGQALKKFARDAAEDDALSTKDALRCAIDGYQVFYRDFIQVSGDGSISSEAEGLHNFLNNPAYKVWLDNEVVDKSKLGECFHQLEDFERMKGFSQQSDKLLKATGLLTKYIEEIPSRPSLISYLVYWPRLDELNGKVLNKYRHLCKTTKPLLKVKSDVDVEISSTDARQLTLTIPVSIEANKAQEAQNVTLIVEESPDFTCDREFLITRNMPSDGRVVTVTVPIQLNNPVNGSLPLRVRVECEYISDVAIEERFIGKKVGKRKYGRREYQEVHSKAYYPKSGDWINLEITVEKKKEKPAIKTKRIQLFSDDGRVSFKEKGIAKILKNREAQIDRAIDSLTMEAEDEFGEPIQVLNDMGRWVLIYGQWRVGKTVILNCIEERLRKFEDAIVVKLTCTGSDMEDFESYFAKKIYDAIHTEIMYTDYEEAFEEACAKVRGVQNENANLSWDWDALRNFIVLFMRKIRSNHPQVAMVLLVDEFTEIYQAIIKGHAGEGFPARWTDFINVTNLLCVTAGGEHTVSLMETYTPNTLQKAEEQIYVQYLTKENVNEYVHYVFYEAEEDKVAEEDSYFSSSYPQALERIFELTQGNAFLLKLFCSKLIDYINENKRPYLTKRDVDANLDYIIQKEDRDSLETKYFNSLYNPFNEESGSERTVEDEENIGQVPQIKRIDDDKVRKDNLDILHKIVERANRDTHICAYDELADALKPVMGDEIFERRMTTLVNRKIIEVDENENVRIFIDLYYELIKRLS